MTKLAQGRLDLHSGRSSIDFARLAQTAREAGASEDLAARIAGANSALEALQISREVGRRSRRADRAGRLGDGGARARQCRDANWKSSCSTATAGCWRGQSFSELAHEREPASHIGARWRALGQERLRREPRHGASGALDLYRHGAKLRRRDARAYRGASRPARRWLALRRGAASARPGDRAGARHAAAARRLPDAVAVQPPARGRGFARRSRGARSPRCASAPRRPSSCPPRLGSRSCPTMRWRAPSATRRANCINPSRKSPDAWSLQSPAIR